MELTGEKATQVRLINQKKNWVSNPGNLRSNRERTVYHYREVRQSLMSCECICKRSYTAQWQRNASHWCFEITQQQQLDRLCFTFRASWGRLNHWLLPTSVPKNLVDRSSNSIRHTGIHWVLCSIQCTEYFLMSTCCKPQICLINFDQIRYWVREKIRAWA